MSGDAVEVKTTLRLQPFNVPSAVRIVVDENDDPVGPAIGLDDLAPEALEALAERWLDNLFATVRRPSPFSRRAKDRA